jgi:hypothetical protein
MRVKQFDSHLPVLRRFARATDIYSQAQEIVYQFRVFFQHGQERGMELESLGLRMYGQTAMRFGIAYRDRIACKPLADEPLRVPYSFESLGLSHEKVNVVLFLLDVGSAERTLTATF